MASPVDLLLTVLIAAYIIYESFEIVKEAVNVLMMGAPDDVSLQRIQSELEAVPGVRNIHHVHVWRMNDQDIHFEAHVDVEDMPVSKCQHISRQIEEKLHELYDITHVTLQFECNRCELKGLVYNHRLA